MARSGLGRMLRMSSILIPAWLRLQLRTAPLWAHLFVTRRCNLRCAYCFVRDPHAVELDEERTRQLILKLYRLGARLLSFFGGEPTLRPDLERLIAYARGLGMITYLSTNGTRLTRERIDGLAEAGLDVFNLSVDSVLTFDPSTKDYLRCQRALALLLEGRARHPYDVTVNCVLTRQNADAIRPTVERISALGIPLSIGCVVPDTYRGTPLSPALAFDGEVGHARLRAALDEIRRLKREGHLILEPMAYFDQAERLLEGSTTWRCPAGQSSISVDSNGDFMFCTALPSMGVNLLDVPDNLERAYRDARERTLATCNPGCLSNCYFDSGYFVRHPGYLASLLWRAGRALARVEAAALPLLLTPSASEAPGQGREGVEHDVAHEAAAPRVHEGDTRDEHSRSRAAPPSA